MELEKLFERLGTNELFTFLRNQDYVTLHLEESDYTVLREMKITGTSFINCERSRMKRLHRYCRHDFFKFRFVKSK